MGFPAVGLRLDRFGSGISGGLIGEEGQIGNSGRVWTVMVRRVGSRIGSDGGWISEEGEEGLGRGWVVGLDRKGWA